MLHLFLWRSDLAIICGVLRCFAAFSGVFWRFLAFSGALAIRGPNIWGGSNPRPLFWSVENNRAKMGGAVAPFPP
jgi:hypothetical protein